MNKFLIILSLAVAGCSGALSMDSSDAGAIHDSGVPITAHDAGLTQNTLDASTVSDCAFPLVYLQTGPSDTCSGGNIHAWPVGMEAGDCHGWRGTDNGGSVHDNSANGIQCNAHGTFQFTQFAGNLNCEGSGVTKIYTLNECQQDIPPRLYTIAFDLTCCASPSSEDCIVDRPSVSVPNGQVMLNGTSCE